MNFTIKFKNFYLNNSLSITFILALIIYVILIILVLTVFTCKLTQVYLKKKVTKKQIPIKAKKMPKKVSFQIDLIDNEQDSVKSLQTISDYLTLNLNSETISTRF